MKDETAQRLIDLNRLFYQSFAREFAATRRRIQPGVRQVLAEIPPAARLLDLGCGNGELSLALRRQGFQGVYVGVDFSPGLLSEAGLEAGTGSQAEAGGLARPGSLAPIFVQADLAAPGWEEAVRGAVLTSPAVLERSDSFDILTAFAVLHHLPGEGLRRRTLSAARRLLPAGGRLFHSEWQFLNSPRLVARLQPWEAAGLRVSEVDPGDYLLDWRHGGTGLRYVHHFSVPELEALASAAGFQVEATFFSDGEGGQLGLYQTWKAI